MLDSLRALMAWEPGEREEGGKGRRRVRKEVLLARINEKEGSEKDGREEGEREREKSALSPE